MATRTLLTQSRSLLNGFIRNKDGHIVLWQAPNFPIIGWFVCMVISKLVGAGGQQTAFEFLSSAFLFTWAYLEIAQGASYFRRLLGLVIFFGIIVSRLN